MTSHTRVDEAPFAACRLLKACSTDLFAIRAYFAQHAHEIFRKQHHDACDWLTVENLHP
jgi:hypothetical protein